MEAKKQISPDEVANSAESQLLNLKKAGDAKQKEVSDEMQIWDYRDSLFIGLSIYRATDSSAKSNTISPAREYKRRQDERITGIRNRIIKE